MLCDETIPDRQECKKICIISACYNVEAYIERFIESIVKQSINFIENITLICVDDGSTDKTKDLIKNWALKYPNNVIYIHQNNAGQANARNTGLAFCKHCSWVSFIDPDDFVDEEYFERCLTKASQQQNISLICSRTIFFNEDTNKFSDSHPLRFRFLFEQPIQISKLKRTIIPAANSALFRFSFIRDNKIKFDDRIKPSFEDSNFVIQYLHRCKTQNVIFVKNAKYYYTKRVQKNSTLDLSKLDPRRYYDQIVYGNINTLKQYSCDGAYVKQTVLYDLFWLIIYLYDRSYHLANILNVKQIDKFINLLREVFNYYNPNEILNFNIINIPEIIKWSICLKFKDYFPQESSWIRIDDVDTVKRELKIKLYSISQIETIQIKIGSTFYESSCKKTIKHTFCSCEMIYESVAWIPIPPKGTISIFVNNELRPITLNNRLFDSINVKRLLQKKGRNEEVANQVWLFIDRVNYADDNAEHLYRWIKDKAQVKECYFVLSKSSPDWNRLYKEDFKLVDYGSDKHIRLLKRSKLIVSSHIDSYIHSINGATYIEDKKIIFLQHGVIKDDLSNYLNSKQKINFITTSFSREYDYLIDEATNFLLTKKEVKLLGQARYDVLRAKNSVEQRNKIIVIMPTWRSILSNKVKVIENDKIIERFIQSIFFTRWNSFLSSDTIDELAELGYEIYFHLHPCFNCYYNYFNLNKNIKSFNSDKSIQDYISRSEFLITDYSSIAFDFALLKKPVFYYQFDRDSFYENHTYRKGYFDYDNDGFGPVCTTEEELKASIQSFLWCKSSFLSKFETRFRSFDVPYSCCQKTFEAIIQSLSPDINKFDVNTQLSDKEIEVTPLIRRNLPKFYKLSKILRSFETLLLKNICSKKKFSKYQRDRLTFFVDSKSYILRWYARKFLD